MNRIIHVFAAVAALACAMPAAAQQRTQPFVGLGVGLPVSELGTIAGVFGIDGGLVAPQLYVPINLTPNVRVEPQFGFLTWHDDATGEERSFKSVGTGVFFVMPFGENADLYVGPRLALSFFRQREPAGAGLFVKRSATDVFFAAALGGEVAVHPRLSVGAEGQLGYTSLGDVDVTDETGATRTVPGGSSWATQGVLFVRVYLF